MKFPFERSFEPPPLTGNLSKYLFYISDAWDREREMELERDLRKKGGDALTGPRINLRHI